MKYQCKELACGHTFVYPATLATETVDSIVEKHVCPWCLTINFEEYVEPLGKIVSVKSVELDKVDDMITQGYEVKELYAKTATMIKKESVKQ